MIAGNNIQQKAHPSGWAFCMSRTSRASYKELIYTFDGYQWGGAVAAKPGSSQKPTDAKLFWNGRSQAVRLPKEFRFEGNRVRVTRMGAGILLEPVLEPRKETPEEWFARIDALKGDPLFPEGRKQNLAPIREYFE